MKSVVILGTGMTISKFDSKEYGGSDIWAVGSALEIIKRTDIKIDLYFCLHKNETIDFDGEIITQKNYPLQEIIEKYNSRYFTNSISYMIAYAIYKGYQKIDMYGVDMNCVSEYSFERPSVSYWMGFARGLSIEVSIASDLDNPIFLYGYDEYSELVRRLNERMEYSRKMANEYAKIGDKEKSNQFAGQFADNEFWIRQIKG
jgi:hypothetical protein